jgi:hypothetical protein
MPKTDEPAWVPCDSCENYWCTIHGMHAFECTCPPIEEWSASPYRSSDPLLDQVADAALEACSGPPFLS